MECEFVRLFSDPYLLLQNICFLLWLFVILPGFVIYSLCEDQRLSQDNQSEAVCNNF